MYIDIVNFVQKLYPEKYICRLDVFIHEGRHLQKSFYQKCKDLCWLYSIWYVGCIKAVCSVSSVSVND